MTNSLNDAPRILIFPPVIPLVTIISTVFLQWLCPLGFLTQVPIIYRISLGIMGFTAGITTLAAAAFELSRNGTNVRPSLPATVLVTTGVYAWTRNPFYVGGSLSLLAVALAVGADWLPLLYVVSLALLHFGVVLPEEAYLDRTFGNSYRRYKGAVPRYFGPTRRVSPSSAQRLP